MEIFQNHERASFSKHILKLQKLKELEFNLSTVIGGVKVTKTITLKPFETRHISALCHINDHKKRINIMLERTKTSSRKEVVLVNSYSVLHPGSSRIQVAVRILTCKNVKIR